MKLDRNINANGMGKYALLRLRKLSKLTEFRGGPWGGLPPEIDKAIHVLEKAGILDWGNTPQSEFMVIRLKDKYARVALVAYSEAALLDDPEYATEIAEMAERSGPASPWCKKPD